MRKFLFIPAAFLTIVFFVSPSFTAAQNKGKSSKQIRASYIEQEAESQARYAWNSRMSRCGDDYYMRDRNYIYQLRNSRVTVSANSLSAADKLNGVEYAGYTYFSVGQSRRFSPISTPYENAGWSRWYDGFRIPQGGFSLSLSLRREDGYWRATPYSRNQVDTLQPVDCRSVYGYRDGFNGKYYPDFDDLYDNPNDPYKPSNPNNPRIRTTSDSTVFPEDRTVNWVRLSRGQSVPNNAITGGIELGGDNNGTTLYVCRAAYNDGVYPGKLLNGSCNIGFGGKETVVSTYEVAVGSGSWSKPRTGFAGALTGGREIYVCRANFRQSSGSGTINYGQYPGRIVDGKCNFAFGTKELTSADFDVFYPTPNYNNYAY
jgi:hypothetical protein